MMKSWVTRMVGVLTIMVALGVAVPAAAYAGGEGRGGAAPTGLMNVNHLSLKAYLHLEAAINQRFESSVAKARAVLRTKLRAARTPGARSTAHVNFMLKIVTASSDRDAALVRLGTAPKG